MTSLMWAIAELLVFAIDVVGPQWYLHKKAGTRNNSWVRLIIGGLAAFALLAVCYFVSVPMLARTGIVLISCIAYALFVVDGRIGVRIFHAIMVFILLSISDASIIALLALLPGVTINMIMQQTLYRLIAMVAAKILFLLLIFHLVTRKSQEECKHGQWVLIVSIPIISLVVLSVLLRFTSLQSSHNSYSLIIVSLGLFIINMVLIALNEQLAIHAKKLVAKEKMLELSEIQNRHFNEVLASNDNMQGFKHDLKNHLQVMYGLLEMKKIPEAKEYLNEIGSFVSKNDLSINCGYPLVDAVMGSKLAIGKKDGIDIEYAILLNKKIEIAQMDLCSILGNTIDNALEACEGITDEAAPKTVSVQLKSADDAILLKIVNTCAPAAPAALVNLKTNKTGEGHGLGLENVRRIVRKNGGLLQITRTETHFQVEITIPSNYTE